VRRFAVLLALVLAALAVLARRRRAHPLSAAPAAPALPAGPRFVSVPWTLVEAPEDQPELRIRAPGGGRVDVRETPTQVFVTVIAGGETSDASPDPTVVALSRPLGARELIHAPVDRAALYP